MSSEIGHLEIVEDRQLDGLLGAGRQRRGWLRRTPGRGRPTRCTRRPARRASARGRTPSRRAGPARCRPARCRCSRSTTSAAQAGARARSGPAPAPTFSARRSRIAPARVTAGARESPSASVSSCPGRIRHGRSLATLGSRGAAGGSSAASLLNRVRYLDFGSRRRHTGQHTAVRSVCWTMGGGCQEEGLPPCRGTDWSRQRSSRFSS